MNTLKTVCLFILIACLAKAGGQSNAWTFVPEDKESQESPWRLVLLPNGEIESQTLFGGVRSSEICRAKIDEQTIEFTNRRGRVVRLLKRDGVLMLHDDKEKKDMAFRLIPEWDLKFEQAPPIPKTKNEAISTLRRIIEPGALDQIRAMKKEDLIRLHFGLGMGIRNAFGLWSEGSPLLTDLGGGHPDDASGRLIEAFWEDLQKDKLPNQAPSQTPT